MEILVTGANGFVGSKLVECLNPSGLTVISRSNNTFDKDIKVIMLDLDNLLSGSQIEGKYDVVVHLAGRTHITNDLHLNPLNELRKMNKDVTLELARQLAINGMKRFVFISSIGVNGASTQNRTPFTENSTESPHSDYAISKFEAELELKKLAKLMNFELVIIRPPLVYGCNAPGNFGKLVNLVNKQFPLPFGLINNKRSYISVTNLTSFIITCLNHPKASNETFLISDGTSISTTGLIQKIKKATGSSSILLPIPKVFLYSLLTLFGRKNVAVQLLDNLEVDCSKSFNILNWSPIETMDDSFSKLRKK
jgi:nucleoside-diphosphate-sugar epimerase